MGGDVGSLTFWRTYLKNWLVMVFLDGTFLSYGFLAWFSGVLFECTMLVWNFTYHPSIAFSKGFFSCSCGY